MKPIRVLLADDHSLFRKGLAKLLEEEAGFEVVGEAEDGAQAVEKTRHLNPDLVLMDISMPGMDGIAATNRIRTETPSAKVVMLTILEEDRRLFEAIKAGAQGYLAKNVNPQDLFQTLRGVVRGEAAISRVTAAKILSEWARNAGEGVEAAAAEQLSAREKEVLQLLAKGLPNKEISAALNIAENTVKNHVKNILEKLHLANRVQAAAYAFERGIVADDKRAR